MTQQSADLTAEVTALAANLADVSTRIDKEIADLAAATASAPPNAAIDAAITNLKSANAQLKTMSGALAADDVVAPPPAP
jgi:uncharacterized membrane protein YccC